MKKKPPICPNCKKPIGGIYNGKLQIVGWDWEGHNCHPESTPAPEWYKKQDFYDWLTSKEQGYSKEVAEELSEKWAQSVQAGFKKGWELARNNNKPAGQPYEYMPENLKAPAPEIPKYHKYCTCNAIMEFENAIHSAIAEQNQELQRLKKMESSLNERQMLQDSIDQAARIMDDLKNQLAAKEKEVEENNAYIDSLKKENEELEEKLNEANASIKEFLHRLHG